ncbi:hypothetical protein [Burkholderia glumae]|uniref:hypothetical protein n=1 Tax=Burkholderia glumae TaxID=337 RepID=UPI00039CA3F0|nr:hypothetical protein [Burkholderia glumae]MCM2544259.1 hypothetical protein [Burkholderia glumae]
MDVKIGVDQMCERLLTKLGLRADAMPAPTAKRLAPITPMLRAGFATAHQEASGRALSAEQA